MGVIDMVNGRLCETLPIEEIEQIRNEGYQQGRADAINAIKNDLHKRLTEEMNKPYQDQGLCQGLYFGIQRCDWYLDDSKEQKNDGEGNRQNNV